MVYVHLAEGFEEIEALTVVDLMRRAQIDVQTVAMGEDKTVTGAHGIAVQADILQEEADYSASEMLVLPGGMPGTKNLRACEPLCDAVRAFATSGRMIAAICAAPSILAELGLLEGRAATSNPNFQHVLAEHGAKVQQGAVVTDGNLMTSKGLGTAVELGLELVRHFLGDDAVEDVKRKIVYQG